MLLEAGQCSAQVKLRRRVFMQKIVTTVSNHYDWVKILHILLNFYNEKWTLTTRDELEDAPGIMNASDDPDEVTLEPHLEMSYRSVMPSKYALKEV